MNLTVQLYEDHAEIKKMLHIMESICSLYHSSLEFDQDYFSHVLNFLTIFVDHFHHQKEEKYLFPAMENAGIQNEGGILEHIRMKHDLGRRYIRDIRIAHDGIVDKSYSVIKRLIDNCLLYTQHLYNHLEMEDTTIFPLADRILPDESKEILLMNFSTVEKEVYGPSIRAEIEKSFQTLYKIYNPQ